MPQNRDEQQKRALEKENEWGIQGSALYTAGEQFVKHHRKKVIL